LHAAADRLGAARGCLDTMLAAFAIVFLWQFPHFMAIGLDVSRRLRVPATSYYLQASPEDHLSPGKPYFHPWHFSQWLSAAIRGESEFVYLAGVFS